MGIRDIVFRRRKTGKIEEKKKEEVTGTCGYCKNIVVLKKFKYVMSIRTILKGKPLGWLLLCDSCKENLLEKREKYL